MLASCSVRTSVLVYAVGTLQQQKECNRFGYFVYDSKYTIPIEMQMRDRKDAYRVCDGET